MAAITGEVLAEHGGRTYTLRLTMLGLGRLQEEFGPTIGGMLDGSAKSPAFSVVVAIVREALRKGEGMGRDEAEALADDIVTANPAIVVDVMSSAFPGGKAGGKPRGR